MDKLRYGSEKEFDDDPEQILTAEKPAAEQTKDNDEAVFAARWPGQVRLRLCRDQPRPGAAALERPPSVVRLQRFLPTALLFRGDDARALPSSIRNRLETAAALLLSCGFSEPPTLVSRLCGLGPLPLALIDRRGELFRPPYRTGVGAAPR